MRDQARLPTAASVLGLEGQDRARGRQCEPCTLAQQETHLPQDAGRLVPPGPSCFPFGPLSSSLDREGPKGVQHVGRWLTP